MKTPKDILEIYLQPGEFYFGDEKTRIRTLLGSCVAITVWHPALNIGGMCHYMLPQDKRKETAAVRSGGLPERRNKPASSMGLDGRYAEDAMQMFLREIHLARTLPADYQVKLFGGGKMFKDSSNPRQPPSVPQQNIDIAHALIKGYGFKLAAQDLGGEGHRNIIFDLWSGDVWVRKAKEELLDDAAH